MTNEYSVQSVLPDGNTIRFRSIRPDDKKRLVEAFNHLSPQTRYFRFFQAKQDLSPKEQFYFTEIDFKNHVGLVATITDDSNEQIVCVARYIIINPKEKNLRAEIGIAVIDDYQSSGDRTGSIPIAIGRWNLLDIRLVSYIIPLWPCA